MGNSVEHFSSVEDKQHTTDEWTSLLCDENSDVKRNAELMLMLESGHASIDHQVLLPDDSSDTESELEFIVQDSDQVNHTEEQNVDYEITQSTMVTQQMDHSSIFIRILSNYILPDGARLRLLECVAQEIGHYEHTLGIV